MTELAYKTSGDYMLPDLKVPTEGHKIGKYGMLRRTYLKNHRRSLYSIMMMNGMLLEHLEEIDKAATEQVQKTVAQMAKTEGVTDAMKEKEPLKWAGLMNNFMHSAEETVLSELIYS
jgi:hypothetical protein